MREAQRVGPWMAILFFNPGSPRFARDDMDGGLQMEPYYHQPPGLMMKWPERLSGPRLNPPRCRVKMKETDFKFQG
jgi:hypothetical protein